MLARKQIIWILRRVGPPALLFLVVLGPYQAIGWLTGQYPGVLTYPYLLVGFLMGAGIVAVTIYELFIEPFVN